MRTFELWFPCGLRLTCETHKPEVWKQQQKEHFESCRKCQEARRAMNEELRKALTR